VESGPGILNEHHRDSKKASHRIFNSFLEQGLVRRESKTRAALLPFHPIAIQCPFEMFCGRDYFSYKIYRLALDSRSWMYLQNLKRYITGYNCWNPGKILQFKIFVLKKYSKRCFQEILLLPEQ
jgi:hypothetical protein